MAVLQGIGNQTRENIQQALIATRKIVIRECDRNKISQVYGGHPVACFTEQVENFGLPNCSEYGWSRSEGSDKGLELNAWLEYLWDTV